MRFGSPCLSTKINTIFSIRAIEQVCLDRYGEVDLTKLVIADFDLAAENAKVNYKASSAYHVGRQLKILLDFLRQLKIVALPEWKNPIKTPKKGVLSKYAASVKSASLGAITD